MPTESATALLNSYQPGAFYLSSPRGGLLGLNPADSVTSAEEARATLGDAPVHALLAGAFPFDLEKPARLHLWESVRYAEPWRRTELSWPPVKDVRWSWKDTGADDYRTNVRSALGRMSGSEPALAKVVLARTLELTADRQVDPSGLLAAVAAGDPHGYTFAADLGDRTLIGASPELLVSRHDGKVLANPLAGSARRDWDPVRDRRAASALLSSAKDRREHDFVATAVADALAPLCHNLTVPPAPSLLSTRTMWHLSTRITGEAREGVSALDLALALHPTPAVCGTPTGRARAVIRELEPFDRGFYAGLVGWTDTRGDGEWVVTIRCGELAGDSLRLFAGAGIVPGSSPEAELAETDAKFRTMLTALGLGLGHVSI